MLSLDEKIAGVSARLAAVGTQRELEKYKLHVQVYIQESFHISVLNTFPRMLRKSPLCSTV